ncbi:hypothetical protein BD770DRAFT_375615, partial [Pilaira anomala]
MQLLLFSHFFKIQLCYTFNFESLCIIAGVQSGKQCHHPNAVHFDLSNQRRNITRANPKNDV